MPILAGLSNLLVGQVRLSYVDQIQGLSMPQAASGQEEAQKSLAWVRHQYYSLKISRKE